MIRWLHDLFVAFFRRSPFSREWHAEQNYDKGGFRW